LGKTRHLRREPNQAGHAPVPGFTAPPGQNAEEMLNTAAPVAFGMIRQPADIACPALMGATLGLGGGLAPFTLTAKNLRPRAGNALQYSTLYVLMQRTHWPPHNAADVNQ